MKNQFLRMIIYSFILLFFLLVDKLNFLLLTFLYFFFMSLEFHFNIIGFKKDSKFIVRGYRILFILTGLIIIFNREKIIG
ncbi:hypothetical protein MKZ17_00705 [Solibacillus sp. FSL R7-0682]|uniref:hypothetical protein n=1 Tax=Solibacillus sp. FSL R7-0682 TaxID=2921690 RepID=UPI0030F4BD1F